MRSKWILAAVAVAFLASRRAGAEDHLLPAGAAQQAAAAAAAERGRDLADVAAALATPEARAAAQRLGQDADRLADAATTLSDAELADLAARARALGRDPVAGDLDPTIRQLLIIFLIVAIVILVFQAID
jgi:hypothetical protein